VFHEVELSCIEAVSGRVRLAIRIGTTTNLKQQVELTFTYLRS
jgi:hypothetical protein